MTRAPIAWSARLVALFPENTHPRITYSMALTNSAAPEAARFAEFLQSDASRVVFKRYGFVVLR